MGEERERGILGSTPNPVREVQILDAVTNGTSSKQDEQQTGRAANRTTSVLDLFPLTAMTI